MLFLSGEAEALLIVAAAAADYLTVFARAREITAILLYA